MENSFTFKFQVEDAQWTTIVVDRVAVFGAFVHPGIDVGAVHHGLMDGVQPPDAQTAVISVTITAASTMSPVQDAKLVAELSASGVHRGPMESAPLLRVQTDAIFATIVVASTIPVNLGVRQAVNRAQLAGGVLVLVSVGAVARADMI